MRDGRRKRLGLVEGSEGTVGDTYLDRILTDAQAAENYNTIAADTDVNFDTRDFRNISDTYNYYYGGGADAATVPATPTTPGAGDGGSSDGGTGGGGGGTTPNANTPFEDYLIDEGAGIQTEPGTIVAPGEYPSTQDEMDSFNQIPVTNVAEFPTGDASLAEQIAAEDRAAKALADEQALTNQEDYRMSQYDSPTPTYYDGTATLQDAGAGEGDMYQSDYQGGEPLSFDDRNQSIEDIDRVSAPYGRNPITGEAYETPRSIADQNAVLGQTFATDDVDADGNLLQSGIDKMKSIFPDFNPLAAIGKIAFNSYIGAPVTLAFDALKKLPSGISTTTNKAREVGLLSGDTTVTQDIYGINTQSAFGDYNKYAVDKAEELQTKFDNGDLQQYKEDGTLTYLGEKQAKYADYAKTSGADGDINPEGTGDGSVMESVYDAPTVETIDPGVLTEDDDDFVIGDETPVDINGNVINNNTDIVDVQAVKDNIKKAEESTITNDITSNQIDEFNIDAVEDYDFSDFDDGDTSVAADTPAGSEPIGSFFDAVDNAAAEAAAAQAASAAQAAANQESYKGGGDGGGGGDNVTDSKSGDTYSGEAYGYNEAAEKGNDSGGGGNGGGKIVCTMMNESYGFGLFRNKIWMKFHKNIAPEYQKGYHKIFLPLVKLSKTNKIVKKVLEHIAVHSTIDMRQATRGKTHLLGRVYRKIILPLCYWAGKND